MGAPNETMDLVTQRQFRIDAACAAIEWLQENLIKDLNCIDKSTV